MNLFLKISVPLLFTAKYHYLFEGRKVFEYQTETSIKRTLNLKIRGVKD